MSSVKLKATDSGTIETVPVEVAVKLLKWKPNLYKVEDENFEFVEGELRRRKSKKTIKRSKAQD